MPTAVSILWKQNNAVFLFSRPLFEKKTHFSFFPPIFREKTLFLLVLAPTQRIKPHFTFFPAHCREKLALLLLLSHIQRTKPHFTFPWQQSTIAKTNFAARRRSVAESCELWGGELLCPLWAWRRIVVALRRRVPFTLLSLAVALHGKTNFARGGGASRNRANCCAWGGKLLCALWAWRRIVFALRRRVPFTFLVAHPRSRTPSCCRANFAAHGAVSCCAHCGRGGAS